MFPNVIFNVPYDLCIFWIPLVHFQLMPFYYDCSVQFSHSVLSSSLWPHGLQHARPPCPAPTPGVYSNSCPLSRWCHLTISSSVVPFSSHLQSFPASGSFLRSQFFASGSQSIGVSASASVLPMNIQDWFPLGLTGLISLQSKGLLMQLALQVLGHGYCLSGPSALSFFGVKMFSFFTLFLVEHFIIYLWASFIFFFTFKFFQTLQKLPFDFFSNVFLAFSNCFKHILILFNTLWR